MPYWRRKINFLRFLLSLIFLICSLSGCSLFKASPGETTPFLPHGSLLVPDPDRSPFNGTYYPDRAKFYREHSKYLELVILPIETKYAEERIRASDDSDDTKTENTEALHETARYFTNRLKTAFSTYQNHPMKIVDIPSLSVPYMTIEIALTELVPTEAAVNFLSTVAGFFVPGTGIIKSFTKGSIAFEAIVRDGLTKEILVECKDRESDKASVFTFRDFDSFSHQRAIIDDWSDQFAQLAATDESVTVEEALPFTLNPI